jgi:hypothetical protein
VALDVECLDRIYLNGYVPTLQVGGQVALFVMQHLGYPIASPAILEKIGTAFRRSVSRFAEDEHIPVVRFSKGDRKIDVMGPYVSRQAATGRSGVAAIGVAQEFQNVFLATERGRSGTAPWFSFTRADRRVTGSVSGGMCCLWGARREPNNPRSACTLQTHVSVWRGRAGAAGPRPARQRTPGSPDLCTADASSPSTNSTTYTTNS